VSLLSPQLEAFLAIVKHKTVHGASRDLHLTQTGVTQRLRALESSLAVSLFTRSRLGMRLTSEGEALLRYCQAARDLEGETLAGLTAGGKKVEVRLAVTGPSSLLRSRIVPQCLPVMKAFPELVMTFDLIDIETWGADLRSGKAQLALLPPNQVGREMDSKRLRPENYLLVASPAWAKRPLKEIISEERIIDFDPTDQMSFAYLKNFGLSDLNRRERHFVNNTESLVTLFKAGMGFGVLTAEFAEPYLRKGELISLNANRRFENPQALAWYPRPQMPAYFKALVKAIH
jgi:LysR family transcriptional regulator, chromosome initiation inhibitor